MWYYTSQKGKNYNSKISNARKLFFELEVAEKLSLEKLQNS